jgi:hypothetical protein
MAKIIITQSIPVAERSLQVTPCVPYIIQESSELAEARAAGGMHCADILGRIVRAPGRGPLTCQLALNAHCEMAKRALYRPKPGTISRKTIHHFPVETNCSITRNPKRPG